jgi:Uma2 family endonuclease
MPAAVPARVSERVIDDRRRLGIDALDECWAGEWHLVNPPKSWHGRLLTDLLYVLIPHARARGLEPYGDTTGLFAAPDDWRVPDHLYARPEDRRDEGFVSAELVVEIRSPGDDTYRKLPFYAGRGVAEVLVVDEARRVALYRLDGAGTLVPVRPRPEGAVRSDVLGVTFVTADGPRLRIAWEGGTAEV